MPYSNRVRLAFIFLSQHRQDFLLKRVTFPSSLTGVAPRNERFRPQDGSVFFLRRLLLKKKFLLEELLEIQVRSAERYSKIVLRRESYVHTK